MLTTDSSTLQNLPVRRLFFFPSSVLLLPSQQQQQQLLLLLLVLLLLYYYRCRCCCCCCCYRYHCLSYFCQCQYHHACDLKGLKFEGELRARARRTRLRATVYTRDNEALFIEFYSSTCIMFTHTQSVRFSVFCGIHSWQASSKCREIPEK